jgi:hypothetical protein
LLLTPERREQLISATREAAAAFVEDLPHIRETVNKVDPDRGELRRLSNVLRRLLIDNGGDLRSVAAPRVGKFAIVTPDNKPAYKADKKRPYTFFGSAGVRAFGIWIRAVAVEAAAKHQPLENFNPEQCIPLPMDNFLAQRVLCLEGKWISQREAIKYIANIASGVHSGVPKDDNEKLIARIRQSATYSALPNAASITFKLDALYPVIPAFKYEADAIDPVLVEVLATGHFLAQSPDLRELELAVQGELGLLW